MVAMIPDSRISQGYGFAGLQYPTLLSKTDFGNLISKKLATG
jgi:hypothetical protein